MADGSGEKGVRRAAERRPAAAVLGGGLTGVLTALELADARWRVVLFEAASAPLHGASLVNEGKIHLGFVYAADSSLRTAARMIDGALAFRDLVIRWTGAESFDRHVSAPFDYYVPSTSQLTPAAIARHFSATTDLWRAREAELGATYLGRPSGIGWRRRPAAQPVARGIAAVFETEERAVDPHAIATALRARLSAHPGIEIRAGERVERVEAMVGGWRVRHRAQGRAAADGPFDAVINAAWEGRRLIDHASGHTDGGAWLTRYKCNLILDAGAAPAPRNFTGVLGPYGDFVSYPSGRAYLSWYPVCKIAADATYAPAIPALSPRRRQMIRDQTIDALAAWSPTLRRFASGADADDVAGGFIVARGQSDIDNPNSGLHRRHEVGVRRLADGYFSIDTGKYVLAPLFAAECVRAVRGVNALGAGRRP